MHNIGPFLEEKEEETPPAAQIQEGIEPSPKTGQMDSRNAGLLNERPQIALRRVRPSYNEDRAIRPAVEPLRKTDNVSGRPPDVETGDDLHDLDGLARGIRKLADGSLAYRRG